jgi:beta-phosphoglucomutase
MAILNEDIKLRMKAETVLFFDMDGTLVDTDLANYLSYKKAINSVIKLEKELDFSPDKRFNRTNLKSAFPNLKDEEYVKIICEKEDTYKEYLSYTKLNQSVADILFEYSKTNTTILVTNCREDRALMTLNYHNLVSEFNHLFFKDTSSKEIRTNKYSRAISCLTISPKNILLFENEKQEIQDAILAGITINNILSF